jgi:hypothetical protein
VILESFFSFHFFWILDIPPFSLSISGLFGIIGTGFFFLTNDRLIHPFLLVTIVSSASLLFFFYTHLITYVAFDISHHTRFLFPRIKI